jgi:hypothetical protein
MGTDMLLRAAVVIAGLVAATPIVAGDMKPEEARRFVVGKLFSFTCFEGTQGAGRIYNDGSVAGSVRFQGSGAQRFVALPPGTLRVKGDAVCASLKGLFFEPCFNLQQTDERSFRGSVSGLSFAYCNFTRRNGRSEMVRTSASSPLSAESAVANAEH